MSAQQPPAPILIADDFDVANTSRHSINRDRPSTGTSSIMSAKRGFRARAGFTHIARRTLGIVLLMITVVLWTASNFLASYMFADDSYSKPYFVTYVNTSFFAISLIPILFRIAHQEGLGSIRRAITETLKGRGYSQIPTSDREGLKPDDEDVPAGLLVEEEEPMMSHSFASLASLVEAEGVMGISETAKLSLEFCLLWFIANYFVAACLKYTSVASSTILTSTSSIWTLIFGAIVRVESFTFKKLIGTLASLAGIILISSIDLSGDNDENRGKFPHKSLEEIAIGDAMAFFSAIMYGLYTVVMKKRIGNEDRVNMPLFFGLVGLFNVIFLWPGFVILHFTGVETFELPPNSKIWTIVLINSISSLVSDFCWAYAMLLTTPLVVTVGISLTIPLSLIGQMVISDQYSSPIYWVGAGIVLISFLFINHESKDEDRPVLTGDERAHHV